MARKSQKEIIEQQNTAIIGLNTRLMEAEVLLASVIDLIVEPNDEGGWEVTSSKVETRAISGTDENGDFIDLAAVDTDVAAAIESCAIQLRFATGTRIVIDGGRHL